MQKVNSILFGFHPVTEALRANRRRFHRIFISKATTSNRLSEIQGLARDRNIEIQYVSSDDLNHRTGSRRHQGVAADTTGFPFSSLEEIVSHGVKEEGAPMVLVLDQILDPHNLGAMARTALCAGIHGMVITKDRSAQPTAASSKVSAGAMEHIRIARVTNLTKALNELKAKGLWIAGTDRYGTQELFATDLSVPLAVVIGGEEKGLRPLVKKQCDYTLAVPQSDTIGSLNASVCAGVIMYEAFRQRTQKA
jgi:23S rRNA (guanosine2251-2'-O)-methyltransferase